MSIHLIHLSNTLDPHGGFEVDQKPQWKKYMLLQTFDFAKLINFSVGWDYHLSKRVDMTLNPFLKYPVTTLTSGDIKFGSGGLKLKLMLIPKK